MTFFNLIGRYFWVLGLITTAYHYVAGMRSLVGCNASDPRTSEAAIRLRRQFAIFASVPWLVMGWGIVVGGVSGVWSFFRPQDGNPYVLAWFGSMFALSVGFAFWIFVLDGAEKIVVLQPVEIKWHRTGFRSRNHGTVQLTTGRVKLFAALGPFWIALWTFLVWTMGVSLPK